MTVRSAPLSSCARSGSLAPVPTVGPMRARTNGAGGFKKSAYGFSMGRSPGVTVLWHSFDGGRLVGDKADEDGDVADLLAGAENDRHPIGTRGNHPPLVDGDILAPMRLQQVPEHAVK